MKNFNVLSKEEKYNLTPEQIEKYIDYACAELGVLLLPDLPIEPNKKNFKPDLTVYEVAGLTFKNPNEASYILGELQACSFVDIGYDYNPGYDYKYIRENIREIKIEPKKVFSTQLFNDLKKEMNEYSASRKRYEAEVKEYNDILSKRSKVADEIWDEINTIKEEYRSQHELLDSYLKYLRLADGNKEIAWKFFEKAYQTQLEQINDKNIFLENLGKIELP